jgi:hypothetical protein
MNIVEQAIEKVGTESELGRKLGVTRQAINIWKKEGKFPLLRTPEVARLSGIPLTKFNPSFYKEVKELL